MKKHHSKQVKITDAASLRAAHEDLDALDLSRAWVQKIRPYKRDRSVEINAVSHGWYAQASMALQEDTPAGIKGYCKLHFGVPILRTDAEFCEMYDRIFKPLDYPTKLEIMAMPGLFDVTSLMKVDQMNQYMKHIQQHYAERGVQLLFPNEPPHTTER